MTYINRFFVISERNSFSSGYYVENKWCFIDTLILSSIL